MPWTKAVFGRLSLLLTATGLAALLGLAIGLVWLVQETRRYSDGVESALLVRLTLQETMSLAQGAETSQRGYLLSGDPAYLEPFRAAEARLPALLDELVERVREDGGRVDLIEHLARRVRAKMGELAETVALLERGERSAALAVFHTGAGRVLMDEIRTLVDGVEQRSRARLSLREEALDAAARNLLIGAAFGLALAGAVAIGVLLIAFRYTRSLEAAEREVREANAALEDRVAERTAALEEANAELRRFAYIVSHDLRSPLVNVMGFTAELESALAQLRAPGPGESIASIEADIAESIAFIRAATTRMDRLINAILRLSREGNRALNPEKLEMAALIEGLAGTLAHQLDAQGATLTIERPLPGLTADRLAVEQVFGNLLDNAVKYLDAARPGQIRIRGEQRGGMAVFEVVDNGRGIDPRDRERIFDLFRRAGAQDRPGEGIGLANVRALVRRMGGSIVCDQPKGPGSVFRVTLPRTPPPMVARAAEETPP
jgi:signal transduction histidine kinase